MGEADYHSRWAVPVHMVVVVVADAAVAAETTHQVVGRAAGVPVAYVVDIHNMVGHTALEVAAVAADAACMAAALVVDVVESTVDNAAQFDAHMADSEVLVAGEAVALLQLLDHPGWTCDQVILLMPAQEAPPLLVKQQDQKQCHEVAVECSPG